MKKGSRQNIFFHKKAQWLFWILVRAVQQPFSGAWLLSA